MKKWIITTALTTILATGAVFAQMPYNFTATTAAYQPLTQGAKLNDTTIWNDEVYKLEIPFQFKLNNKSVSHFYIQGGEIALGDTLGATDAIAFMSTDLIDRGIADTPAASKSPIRYIIEGTTGSRILKLELANAGFAQEFDTDTTTKDFFNLQLWLHEGSNVFELRYGTHDIADFDDYFAFLGMLTGFAVNMNLGTGSFDKMYILAGDPAAPVVDSLTTTSFTPGLTSFPDSGTVYRFTPKPTGIADKAYTGAMKLYPTRCTDMLMVENPHKDNTTYRVLSYAGATLKHGSIDAGLNKLDVSSLPSGMYLIRFDNIAGFETQKFVKL